MSPQDRAFPCLVVLFICICGAAAQFANVQMDPLHLGPIPLIPQQTMMSMMAPGPKPVAGGKTLGITGITFGLVDQDNNTVTSDRVYLHHSLLLNTNQSNMVWPCDPGEVLGGVGAEFTPLAFPYPYIYPVYPNDAWIATFHIINLLSDYITVTLQINVTYIVIEDPSTLDGYKPLRVLYLDVDSFCGMGAYDLSGQGGINVNRHTYETHFDGEFVYAFGHLHAPYGISVSLVDVTTDSANPPVIFLSLPTYSADRRLIGMGHGPFTPPYPISSGTKLQVVSVYNDTVPQMGVMGIVLVYTHVFKFENATLPVSGGLLATTDGDSGEQSSSSAPGVTGRYKAELVFIGIVVGAVVVSAALLVYKIVQHVRAKKHREIAYDRVEKEVFSL